MVYKKKVNNQLSLFDDSYPQKVDKFVFEVQCLMGSYKWVALLVEIAKGPPQAFECLKASALELAKLLAIYGPQSGKYRGTSREAWKKLGVYDPYYPALEPRSPQDLCRIARDYKSRSKAILLRFRGILDKGGKEVQTILKNFYDLNEKIVIYLGKDE